MAAWITKDELKAFLNFTKLGTADDAALDLAIEVACGAVESGDESREGVGPVLTATISAELVRDSGYALALTYRANSVSAVAAYPSGTALTAADYRVDGQVLSRKDGGWISGPLTVTYSTGYGATAPGWAKASALMIARQYWRGQIRPATQGEPVPVRDLIPPMAYALMKPYVLAPGGFA